MGNLLLMFLYMVVISSTVCFGVLFLLKVFPPKVTTPDGTYVSSDQEAFVLIDKGRFWATGTLLNPGDFAAFIEGREVTVSDEIVNKYRLSSWK